MLAATGVDDVLSVRFAWSPLWEAMHAVRSFYDQAAGPYHRAWHQLVADRLERVDLEPLMAVQPLKGFIPDFLTPPPRTSAPRPADQLDEVRATPPEQVERELLRCRQTLGNGRHRSIVDSYLGDPAAARDLLADRLEEVWTELLSPFWPRVRALLDRDIQERSRRLARYGLRRVLDELHPRIRWSETGLWVGDGSRARYDIGTRGLVLMPSAYLRPAVAAIVDEPWQPTIAYPARGTAELWLDRPAPPEALARLIGRTRATVLAGLDHPASTQAVAARLGISPAGASGHLLALRHAGLLSATRHGHAVLYERTGLGTDLLGGASR